MAPGVSSVTALTAAPQSGKSWPVPLLLRPGRQVGLGAALFQLLHQYVPKAEDNELASSPHPWPSTALFQNSL